MESFLCMGIPLVIFSIEGKTPEEKEILNISDSYLEMSLLSNLNVLVGILLGPTDLLESNDDITFSISVLSMGLTKENLKNVYVKMKH